jgi:fructose-1,6-bisphosphatase I
MSFIIEKAGGLASTGKERILDIVPNKIHQRVPVFMGSREDVQDIIGLYAKYSSTEQ